MSNQALVKNIVTNVIAFEGKPDAETIRKLKAAGTEYKNGQWVRSRTASAIVSEAEAIKQFAS